MHPIKHRFRTGLVVGLGLGYVFGTRAGRERYQQLLQAWQRVQHSPPARKIEEAAGSAIQTVEHRVQEAVKPRRSGAGGNGTGASTPGTPGRTEIP